MSCTHFNPAAHVPYQFLACVINSLGNCSNTHLVIVVFSSGSNFGSPEEEYVWHRSKHSPTASLVACQTPAARPKRDSTSQRHPTQMTHLEVAIAIAVKTRFEETCCTNTPHIWSLGALHMYTSSTAAGPGPSKHEVPRDIATLAIIARLFLRVQSTPIYIPVHRPVYNATSDMSSGYSDTALQTPEPGSNTRSGNTNPELSYVCT